MYNITNDYIEVGTRILTKQEIKNILPTYNNILKDIEIICKKSNEYKKFYKKSKNKMFIKDVFSLPQTTNNISIIGSRGSGKTSIMKTLYKDLYDNRKKYFILQGIVPENMEDIVTLMSYFLGSLKDKVDEISQHNKNIGLKDTCFIEKSKIEIEYDDLLEAFGYLQQKYQEIIVNTYTTTPSHIEITKKIFAANTNFIQKFHWFINSILDSGLFEDDAVLINFIDDIDLSTHRSMEVVKTLLTYFAHPRIITFISCDLETFEESLTLEFLRQEKIEDAAFLSVNFLQGIQKDNDDKNILKRKNILAYEYLKKILPAKYRYRINEWNLQKRSIYFCDNYSAENELTTGNKNKTLLQYLLILSENNLLLDKYFSIDNEMPILPIFNIFDKTARGLSNVYGSLYTLINNYNIEDKEQVYIYKKLFLENIVYSNHILNEYRDLIFYDILTLANTEEDCKVNFENIQTLYKNLEENNNTAKFNYFVIFTFLDFSCRLLNKNILNEESYKSAKNTAFVYLFDLPQLYDKNIKGISLFDLSINDTSDSKSDINNILKFTKNLNQFISFLFDLDFEEGIVYFKEMELDKLLEDSIDEKFKDNEIYFSIKFYNVIKIISKNYYNEELKKLINNNLDNLEIINLYKYNDFNKEIFQQINNNLFIYIESLKTKVLMKDSKLVKDIQKRLNNENNNTYNFESNIYTFINKNIIIDINAIIENNKELLKNIFDIKENYSIKNIESLEIFQVIDEYKLWNKDISQNAINYLKKCIGDLEKEIIEEIQTINFNIKEFLQYFYNDFQSCYKGVTYTKADELNKEIKKIIKSDKYYDIENIGIDLEGFLQLSQLTLQHYNSRAIYGIRESIRMNMLLKNSQIILIDENNQFINCNSDSIIKYRVFLYYYLRKEILINRNLLNLIETSNSYRYNMEYSIEYKNKKEYIQYEQQGISGELLEKIESIEHLGKEKKE